uniref:Reverse transcriptase zinc-binding domain-containing protein n=1 Tax=Davidia involucrata TaxID=16924 RepID=A0A5B7BDA2_DAVIN
MQVYWASLFILPKKVIDQVEQNLRRFLWTGTEMKKSGAKVAWKDVTLPKEVGGLGIKKVSEWNLAANFKHLWNLIQPHSKSPWVQWVKINLLKRKHLWEIKRPPECSWIWGKLLKLRDRFKTLVQHIVGNGMSTSLWFDQWLPEGSIWDRMGERVIYDSGLPREATVSSIIQSSKWCWPIANSPHLMDLKENMPANPCANNPDQVRWLPSSSGVFTICSAWNCIRTRNQKTNWWRFPNSIPTCSFVLWMAIREKLNTQDRILSYGGIPSMSCVFCAQPVESHDHLFFQCIFTKELWLHLLARCELVWIEDNWQHTIEWARTKLCGKTLKHYIGKLVFSITVYTIWLERNRRTFAHEHKDMPRLITDIQNLVKGRLMGARGFPRSTMHLRLQSMWGLHDGIYI